MIRLTPFAETVSAQELIKDERVKTLTRQVARKFSLSPEAVDTIQAELDTLDVDSLAQLLDQIIAIDTFKRFQQRVAECQSLVSA
jgi:hypothetical protein